MTNKDDAPPGYPKVPDVESPSDTKLQDQAPPGYPSTSAPQQYPYPGYPNMPPPGVGLEAQQHLYPAGPGALPPAGTYPPYQGGPGGPPPPGAPGAPPPGEPAIGIPVLGDRVSYITHHPMWGPNDNTRDSRFTCTAWLTFFLGFFMPIFWFISTLLPLCLPGRAVRQAACASCIAAIVYLILALALGPTLSRRYY